MSVAPAPAEAAARSTPATDRTSRLLAHLVPLAALVGMLALSWNRWADPLVDTGRELEVPLRLAAGERLYADVHSYYGPLAPLLLAAGVKLFGGSLPLFVATGVALSAASLLALVRLALRVADPLAATVATTLVAIVPMFLPVGGSWVLPYSYPALLAATLSFVALALAADPTRGRLRLAGLVVGLAALAKLEVVAAPLVAVPAALLLVRADHLVRRLVDFLVPAALLPLLGYGIALRFVPPPPSRRESFLALLDVPEPWRHLYRILAGFDAPGLHLLEVLLLALLVGLTLALLALVAAVGGRRRKASGPPSPGASGAPGGALLAAAALVGLVAGLLGAPFLDRLSMLPPLVRLLPPAAVAGALFLALRAFLRRDVRYPLLLVAFAAAVGGSRILLGARDGAPYSAFGLPLPLLAAALLLGSAFLPARLEAARPGAGTTFRLLLLALLLGWGGVRLWESARWFRGPGRWVTLDSDFGRFDVTPPERGKALEDVLALLRERSRPGDRLVVLPEGSILNVLSGLPNPLPQTQVLPGMLDVDGEREFVRRLSAAAPRWVVAANLDFGYWGVGRLGEDWGQSIVAELARGWQPVAVFGSSSDRPYPTGPGGLELVVLERKGAGE